MNGMTPEQMQIAGELLNECPLSDEQLSLAMAGLDHVIPFLEGLGYNRWMLSPLRLKRTELEGFQIARKNA